MNYSSLIDRYIEGTLSEKERKKFEQELKNNPALGEAVNKLKFLHYTISKYAQKLSSSQYKSSKQSEKIKDEIDLDLAKYSSDHFPETDQRREDRYLIKKILEEKNSLIKSKYILINRSWIIAAGMAVLISLSSIVVYCRSQFNPSKTFEKNYTQPILDHRTRSLSSSNVNVFDPASASPTDIIYVACINYSQGNFGKAIELLSYIPEGSSFKERCHLITGLSYMELERYNQAIIEFEQVTEDILRVDTAKWYLGLSYLKIYNLDQALEQFTYLASRDHSYGHSSRKISKKLSRNLERKPIF